MWRSSRSGFLCLGTPTPAGLQWGRCPSQWAGSRPVGLGPLLNWTYPLSGICWVWSRAFPSRAGKSYRNRRSKKTPERNNQACFSLLLWGFPFFLPQYKFIIPLFWREVTLCCCGFFLLIQWFSFECGTHASCIPVSVSPGSLLEVILFGCLLQVHSQGFWGSGLRMHV